MAPYRQRSVQVAGVWCQEWLPWFSTWGRGMGLAAGLHHLPRPTTPRFLSSSFQPSISNAPSQAQSTGGWVQGLSLAALGLYPTDLHCHELWAGGSHNSFP